MATKNTITMFDAELQRDAEHTLTVDGNGEVVLTSVETGRFVKLPKGTTPDELKAYVEAHKAANMGQVSVASIEAKEQELLSAFDEGAAV